MAKRDMINSVIGDGSSFKGTFIVKGSFQIDGKFEGELKIDGHLVIGPNGKVKTSTIMTESITIAGTLIGNIDAKREVILIETGRVLGNIEAPKIDVGEGAGEFIEGLAAVSKDGKWGFIDTNGNEVITPRYDSVNAFCNGYASVELNDKWGVIDTEGNTVIDFKYNSIGDFTN